MGTPTIVRALDINGDWTFGGGESNYLEGNDAISQQIKCRLQEFVSNCFWNPQGGLDWRNLLGQRNNQQMLNLQVGSIISNTDGVTFLQQLNVTLNRTTRQLNISWRISTVYSIYSASFQAAIPQPVGG